MKIAGIDMRGKKRRSGLTLLEVILLIGLITSVIALLLSAIQGSRERARRMTCMNNLKRIGAAFQQYFESQKRFPPSSGVTRSADGKIASVDGWSWSVSILPYMEQCGQRPLYNTLDLAGGRPLVEATGTKGTPHADALATSLPEFLCPSFGGSPFVDPNTKKEAITNYKGMGATHLESLSVASPHPLTPKYGQVPPYGDRRRDRPPHPDGACFPGNGLEGSDFGDGSMWTILAVESVEPRFARWTVGAEATVVGLPPIVEFGYWDGSTIKGDVARPSCITIKGLSNVSEDGCGADPCYWTYRTYLNWDYAKNPYDGADGTKYGQFGPSSNHPVVVNHLLADGSVRQIKREIDVSVYMRMITRSLGD